ncbi:hypothetical protein O1611_g10440 [Lasiodiplodia mahajangana]|uniref:Uncharacterized protein n=1 Tax=Lasiodiplodia mahajangana TaxID=1108764 RepID=A0ACC2IY29_9PEZI|nr:hypothetical protein O1611_g10440 [Lasiodiplodia mahajangana]
MANRGALKRMMSEVPMLREEKPEYAVFFEKDNIMSFNAYITAPDDSVYRHKLLKVHINIPDDYPDVNPEVKFFSFGEARIHPNFYLTGGICLDLLGTTKGRQWSPDFNVHALLMSIRYHLDNDPWKHEMLSKWQPESRYRVYVRYVTWEAMLLNYFFSEEFVPAQLYIAKFIRERAARMMEDFFLERTINKRVIYLDNDLYQCEVEVDYETLLLNLRTAIQYSIDV